MTCRMLPIELVQQIQPPALLLGGDLHRRIEIGNRLAAGMDARALIDGGHEAGAPVAGAIVDRRGIILHHDKRRQVFVLRSQPVRHPRSQRWPAADDRAGVHLADAVGVIQAIRPARMNDGDVVNALGGVRQPIRHPQTAFSMPRPAPPRRQDRRVEFPHRRDDRPKAVGNALPREPIDQRLRIERVEMARPSFHEAKDHALRLGREVLRLGTQRIRSLLREQRIVAQKIAQCQSAEASAAFEQHLAARINGVDAIAAVILLDAHGGP